MNVLRKLGDTLRKTLTHNASGSSDMGAAKISKVEIPRYLDAIQDDLTAVSALFHTGLVGKALTQVCDEKVGKDLKKVLDLFTNGLPSRYQSEERHNPLSLVPKVIAIYQEDINALRKNFDAVFGPATTAELALSDMRMSTAYAFGYMETIVSFIKWVLFIVDRAGPSVATRPPYQMIWLQNQTPSIAASVTNVLMRHGTVVDEINRIKKSGNDVLVVSEDGETVDGYANDSDFTPDQLRALSGFIRSPSMMIGAWLASRRAERYKNLVYMRDWIAARTSILTMDLTKHDENSPEYQRLAKIIANYQVEQSRYDRDISEMDA